MTKRGRPKKQEHEKRTVRLPYVRLTAAERFDLEAKAERAGVDLSVWVRQQLTAAPAKRMTPQRVDASLISELSRIGNNVNQIARSLNRGRDEDPHHLNDVMHKLHSTLETVARRYGS